MWRIIKYLFYKKYQFHVKHIGTDTPEFSVMLRIAVQFILNIFSIAIFLAYVFNKMSEFDNFIFNLSNITKILIMLVSMVSCYFMFLYKSKYKEIIKEYQNESNRQRKAGSVLVTAYGFLTVIFLIFIVIYTK